MAPVNLIYRCRYGSVNLIYRCRSNGPGKPDLPLSLWSRQTWFTAVATASVNLIYKRCRYGSVNLI